jgi:recombinational DNA repair ATPase RecF
MDDVLLGIVLRRLDDIPLQREAFDLLLAALEGDEELAAQLNTEQAQDRYVPAGSAQAAPPPVGAYLRSLTVSGFRGIGPPATLRIAPGPGLTLVVGRNGSGKSSFAEALEVLLTGTLMRWDTASSVVVREGWRSKHATDGTEIRADFLIEGKGETAVARTWEAWAGLDGSAEWLQVAGAKKEPSLDGLGWAADLRSYRPFLSHAELEAFFGKPSELHDLLASVLGLDELTDTDKRLDIVRRSREAAFKDVTQRLNALLTRLTALDDERARACLDALRGRTWDIAAARAAAAGGEAPDGGQLATLRLLAQLAPPSDHDVRVTVTVLRDTADQLDGVTGTSAGQARNLARLLGEALRHHEEHGDGDCPVCGRTSALTRQWQEETRRHRNRLREEAQAADVAFRAAKTAADQALALMQQPPPVLGATGNDTAAGLDVAPARDAWRSWAERPAAGLSSSAGLRILAEHLESAVTALTEAVTELSAAAASELAKRDDRWAPLAAEVTAWCAGAEPAVRENQPVKSLKDARKWLVDATADLRNQRLAPLADQAREIWAKLRQESNVDLGAFRLAGSATRRQLELDVRIDGAPGPALGTMSQGEINALALSIFLPRATMANSPFRFLVIDDPVQAMDPAKVDGLARVLHEVAATRQVIVFTHDNRLATAVKELSIPATILEVTRRPGSVVDVRPCLDPPKQALKDACDLIKDQHVPAEVAARVVPGLCRTAVEAAFMQAHWRRELRKGRTRAAIESGLEGKKLTLMNIAALGMFGDREQGWKVLSVLYKRGCYLADTLKLLNTATHEGHAGDLDQLIKDAGELVKTIEKAWS